MLTNNHNSAYFDLLGDVISANVCNYTMCVTIIQWFSGCARYMRMRAGLRLPRSCAMHVPRIMKTEAMH